MRTAILPLSWGLASAAEWAAWLSACAASPRWGTAAAFHVLSGLLVALSAVGRRRSDEADLAVRAGFQSLCALLLPGIGLPLAAAWALTARPLDPLQSPPDEELPASPASESRKLQDEAAIAERIRDRINVVPLEEMVIHGDLRIKQRAIERLARRRTPAAVRSLRRALEDPIPDIQFYASNALSRIETILTQQTHQAEIAAAEHPDSASAQALLGNRYFDYVYMGLLDPLSRRFYLERSIRAYSEALALDPRQSQILVRLARARMETGDPAAAIHHLDRALELDIDTTEALLWRAEARYVLGDLKGAREDALRAREAGPIPPALKDTVQWFAQTSI